MGIVSEYYIVADSLINQWIYKGRGAKEYFDANFSSISGVNHIHEETVFGLDKLWDIAIFLLMKTDSSADKALQNTKGTPFEEAYFFETCYYIESNQVKKIKNALEGISILDLEESYNSNELVENNIYGAESFTKENSWESIIELIEIIKNIFRKASENHKGVVINYC